MVGGIVDFGGDLAGTNCFTSSTVGRALTGMTGVHVKEGGPGGGPGGCLKGGVAIGGERSGNGSDGGDVGLLGDGVGVGGGAPSGFGLGPHGCGNGEGDRGGGGVTLAECCRGCVCRFAGGGLTEGCTKGIESAECSGVYHAGGSLAGSSTPPRPDSEGADCWRGEGQLRSNSGGDLTGGCTRGSKGAECSGVYHAGGSLTGSRAPPRPDGEDVDC